MKENISNENVLAYGSLTVVYVNVFICKKKKKKNVFISI